MKRDKLITCRISMEMHSLMEKEAKSQHRSIAGLVYHQLLTLYAKELHGKAA